MPTINEAIEAARREAAPQAVAQTDATDEPVGHLVAGLALIVCIYLAIWQIPWSDASWWQAYVIPVAFCIIVPSVLGSLTGAIVRASR